MVVCVSGNTSLPPRKRQWAEVFHCDTPEASSNHKADAAPSSRSSTPCGPSPNVPAVVVLGEEGGPVWHVEGLLELLAGALSAALGGDAATLPLDAPDGHPAGFDHQRQHPQQQQQQQQQQHSQQHELEAKPIAAPAPPTSELSLTCRTRAPALTEANLSCTRSRSAPLDEDEDDRSSVASLSAWVQDGPCRRRCSEGGALLSGSPRTPCSGLAPFYNIGPGFSFSSSGTSASGGSGGSSVAEGTELRWPRRRLSIGSGRQ